jgi:hypothetical protein
MFVLPERVLTPEVAKYRTFSVHSSSASMTAARLGLGSSLTFQVANYVAATAIKEVQKIKPPCRARAASSAKHSYCCTACTPRSSRRANGTSSKAFSSI